MNVVKDVLIFIKLKTMEKLVFLTLQKSNVLQNVFVFQPEHFS